MKNWMNVMKNWMNGLLDKWINEDLESRALISFIHQSTYPPIQ